MSISNKRRKPRAKKVEKPARVRRSKTSGSARRAINLNPGPVRSSVLARISKDQLVAAFDLGRSINRFGFHSQQAWLHLPGQQRPAKEAAEEICRYARSAVAVRYRASLSQKLKEATESLLSRPGRED